MRLFAVLAVALIAFARAQDETGAGGEPAEEEKTDEQKRREEVGKHNYCEADNCYELLGVKSTSKLPAIKRAYRKLAAEWHPDKNPDPRARELFTKYANAYDVLSSEKMRANYDYLVANPYEFPGFYGRYSRPVYQAKSDVRMVIIFTVLVLSAIQFLFQQSTYKTKLDQFKLSPGYQDRLRVLIAEQSSKPASASNKTTSKGKKETTKAEVLEERKKIAEAALAAELVGTLPSEPKITDTLIVAVFKSPITISAWMQFHGKMFITHTLLRMDYTDAEKEFLTYTSLAITKADWDESDDADKEEMLGKELWVKENLAAWEAEIERSERSATKSGKEKRLARQKKKGPLGHVAMLD